MLHALAPNFLDQLLNGRDLNSLRRRFLPEFY
jgi:hypothetical protein